MTSFQLTTRTGHPEFLDLPWDRPLEEWDHERLVALPVGIHRHVVRTVQYTDRLYHLKELPRRYAQREWRFLRRLEAAGVPVVEVVGVVHHRNRRGGDPLDAVLITRHLDYSVPYRLLFLRRTHRELREPMLDAMVHLLVQLHLNGFFWGDCSLSNTLFRRDAGRLAAYLVDAETGELHASLSAGQRRADVELAIEKCAGELMDLQAAGVLPPTVDPVELAGEFERRYAELWAELTLDEVFAEDERHRIHRRLERINALGYDVEELELVGDEPGLLRMKLQAAVVEPGRYRRMLRQLVGLDAQDRQAARLLNDIHDFGAWLEHGTGRPLPEVLVAHRWLAERFEPTVAQVPDGLWGPREPAEVYLEVLGHWRRWSEQEGSDLELAEAARRYVDEVLAVLPEERRVGAAEAEGGEPA